MLYELGDGQWDSPSLRTLLEEVLSLNHAVHDFEVDHAFPGLGQRTMVLNARRFPQDSQESRIDPAPPLRMSPSQKRVEVAMQSSEVPLSPAVPDRKDGILVLRRQTP